jgi:hypothetical protein
MNGKAFPMDTVKIHFYACGLFSLQARSMSTPNYSDWFPDAAHIALILCKIYLEMCQPDISDQVPANAGEGLPVKDVAAAILNVILQVKICQRNAHKQIQGVPCK